MYRITELHQRPQHAGGALGVHRRCARHRGGQQGPHRLGALAAGRSLAGSSPGASRTSSATSSMRSAPKLTNPPAPLTPVQAERIVQILRSEVECYVSPRARIDAQLEEVRRFTPQQFRVLDQLADNPRLGHRRPRRHRQDNARNRVGPPCRREWPSGPLPLLQSASRRVAGRAHCPPRRGLPHVHHPRVYAGRRRREVGCRALAPTTGTRISPSGSFVSWRIWPLTAKR